MHVWKRSPKFRRQCLYGLVAAAGASACSLQDYDALTSGVGGASALGGASGSGGASGGTSGGNAGTAGVSAEPDAGPPLNVFANASFDDGPSLWAPVGNCVTQLVTENPRSASNCLMTSNRTMDWEGPGYALMGRIEPGLTYEARVWARADAAGAEYTLKLTYKKRCTEDPAEGVFSTLGSRVVSDQWTELTGLLVAPECTLLESQLYVEGAPVGESYCIDDTSLLLMP